MMKQKIIEICFEDLETGYVLATIPEDFDNKQILWLIQSAHEIMADSAAEQEIDYDPSITRLCRQLQKMYDTVQFTPLMADVKWCDNSPRIQAQPSVLSNSTIDMLDILQSFYKDKLARYEIHPTYIEDKETFQTLSLKDGLSTIYMDIKDEDLTKVSRNHQSYPKVVQLLQTEFYHLLKTFDITVVKPKSV